MHDQSHPGINRTAEKRRSSPAPCVEGGNDGLHDGDESMMGEVIDKEMASAKGSRGVVS